MRFGNWTWLGVILLLGFALGGATGYYFFVRDLRARSTIGLNAIQKQLTPPPASDTKPTDGQATKPHRRR